MAKEPANPAQRLAVVAGATGLVGGDLLRRLLDDDRYDRVVALTRKPLATTARKLVAVRADYEHLAESLAPARTGAAIDVFCCLGTTIAAAGSEAAFRRVDHDFVLALGRWAVDVRARRMIVISALGADATSRVFYNRVKGETERDLQALRLPSLTIVRPSLLAGKRDEFRFGERVALALTAPLRVLIPARVRPVAAIDVAQAMIDAAQAEPAPRIVESATIHGTAAHGQAPR